MIQLLYLPPSIMSGKIFTSSDVFGSLGLGLLLSMSHTALHGLFQDYSSSSAVRVTTLWQQLISGLEPDDIRW